VRILFTSTEDTPFIREDVLFLEKSNDVRVLKTIGWKSIYQIIKGVRGAQLTFTWFASVYSGLIVFLCRLFGKKSVIVVGGVDAARVPEFSYGIWISPWKSNFVRYAMVHADRLLVVNAFLRDQVVFLACYGGENISVVPTGYDPVFWAPQEVVREREVITVAACKDVPRAQIKGISFLLDTARVLPDTHFRIVGLEHAAMEFILRLKPPPNVTITRYISRNELREVYRRASVYCQPSYYEGGLTNSLCEAMLCGCIPVGTSVGGIPEAIDGLGYLVQHGDVSALASALQKALDSPQNLREEVRESVRARFPLENRESLIRQTLSELFH
jgi:glycosyltransferase involved in cell wall biosynthesis